MFHNPLHSVADSNEGSVIPPPSRSTPGWAGRNAPWIKTALYTIAFVALLLTGLATYGVSRFGSVRALVALLRGRILIVEPECIDVGQLKPREHVSFGVRLRNLASRPIKVLGSHSIPSCGCLVAHELPLELAAGEVKEVPIHLSAPADGMDNFEIAIVFYTNVVGEQPQVTLHGRILPADVGNGSSRNAE
jgi:hypothetical protein